MFNELLLKLIVLFLPTQLGLHFWPSFSRVGGIKIDYLSPTLYSIDILLLVLVAVNFKSLFLRLKKHYLSWLLLLCFVVLNSYFAVSPLNTIFWWLRTLLYVFVFIVIKTLGLKWNTIKKPLFIGTFAVVLIEIFQFTFQHSLNGPFYYLGERFFGSSTTGLGRLNLFGREIIRPMSTFSHPNSLAGYLLVVFYLFTVNKENFAFRVIPFVGILLTFSKTALVFLCLYLFHLPPQHLIVISLFLSLLPNFLDLTRLKLTSLTDRLFYHSYQNQILTNRELTGVGLGSYIPALEKYLPGSSITPQKLQPIHNLFYLFISETGVLGTTLLALSYLKAAFNKVVQNPKILGLISLVAFTGSFDHYFWTLPQNKLILLLALSVLF